jgi:ferrochelatase
MAHGTPSSQDNIEAYLTNIRNGDKPRPEEVEDLRQRYQKIGGKSPLLQITMSQASAVEEALNSGGLDTRVYVGMRYWHPYIEEVVPQILSNGFRRVVALALVPFYSHLAIGGYRRALNNARQACETELDIDLIESWYDHPLFHRAVAEKIRDALKQFPAVDRQEFCVVFTAHSLPEPILRQNDPYPKQFEASCEAVARLLRIDSWSLAYQSAGGRGEKWLGPDVLDVLRDLSLRAHAFGRNVLIVPIGFVADHLEILYDLDIEAQAFATARALTLKRTESLNASPTFISALADIVVDNCQRS